MKQTSESSKNPWPRVPLERVTSKVGSGATPRGGDAVYQKSGIPLVRSMNVRFEGFRSNGLAFINEAQASELDNVVVQANDVFFNITGASIGRVTVAPAEMAGARVNQHVCIIRTTEILDPHFLAYFLASSEQQSLIQGNQTGGTRQALTKKQLMEWKCPLPPPGEQRRIVELLEQADALRCQRDEANKLANRILPSLFRKMFGDPVANERRWPIVRFDTLGNARLGKMLDGKRQTGEHKRPYLRNVNVQWARFDLSSILEMDFLPDERAEFCLEQGDLLICEGGEVGRAAIWEGQIRECYFQKALHRVRPESSKATPEFLLHWLWAMSNRRALVSPGAHATIPHLTGVQLAALGVIYPDLRLQKKFSEIVRQHRAGEIARAHSTKNLGVLFQTMLHRAFNGQLTARWREAHMTELLAEMEQQARILKANGATS